MKIEIPKITAQLAGNLEAIRQDLLERAFIGDDAEVWGYLKSAQSLAGMQAAEIAFLQSQIDSLATFIIRDIPGEPSRNEGAVETAIRLLKKWKR